MLQASICYFQNIDFSRALQLNLIQISLPFACHCTSRSILPNMFLGKRREHPCQSVISIKLQSSFIEITLRHGCSPVNLLHFSKHLWVAVSEYNNQLKSRKSSKPFICYNKYWYWDISQLIQWMELNPLMYNVPKWSDTL